MHRITSTPFSEATLKEKAPKGFVIPKFNMFDGIGNPIGTPITCYIDGDCNVRK